MRSYEMHATPKQVQRSSGRSSVAAAAYRSATRLHDDRTGETHDYTRKQGVEQTRLYLPDNAPDWAQDRQQLWNAAEAKENRKNSMTAREFEIGFPAEFNAMQRREAGDAIARELVNRYGVAVDVAYHAPSREGDQRNHHAHMLYTTRAFDETRPDGWARTKYRDLSTDPIGYDVNGDTLRDQQGKIITRAGAEILDIRHFMAGEMNRIAERDRLQVRTEHLSFVELGIDREPTQHLGPHASMLERNGLGSYRGDANRAVVAANENREIYVKRQDFTRAQATLQHRRDMVGYFAAQHRNYGHHKAELNRTEAAYLEARVTASQATFFDRVRGREKAYQQDLYEKRRSFEDARSRMLELVNDRDRQAIMRGDFSAYHRTRDYKIRDAMRSHRDELAERHKERMVELKGIEDAQANRTRSERIMGALNGKTRAEEHRAKVLNDERRVYEERQRQHERFLRDAEKDRNVVQGGAGGSGRYTPSGAWDNAQFWRGAHEKQDTSFARVIDSQGDRTALQDNFPAANQAQLVQASKQAFLDRQAATRDREQAEIKQTQEIKQTEAVRPENMTADQRIQASKEAFEQKVQAQRDAPSSGGGEFSEGGQQPQQQRRGIERE